MTTHTTSLGDKRILCNSGACTKRNPRQKSAVGFISVTTLIALTFDQALKFATSFFLAFSAAQPLLIYIGMVGIYPLLWLLLLMVLSKPVFRVAEGEYSLVKAVMVVILVSLLYFAAWFVMGFIAGQHPKDVLGSTLRALLPFLLMWPLLVGLTRAESISRERFFKAFVVILFAFALLYALAKIYLLNKGIVYGGGANQFFLGSFLLIWMLLYLYKSTASPRKKALMFITLLLLVVLSILSLKRGIWVNIALCFSLFFFALNVKQRIVYFFLLAIGALFVLNALGELGYIDRVISRFSSTYSINGGGLGPSSQTRLAEVKAAFYTLSQSPLGVGWLTGMGPGAGYENPYGFDFKNFNEYGEPYHIHAALGIIIFRYGLIGFFLYMIPVVFVMRCFFKFSKNLKHARDIRAFDPNIVGFAASGHVIVGIPFLLTGNVFFGDLLFGFFCILSLFSFAKVRRRNRLVSKWGAAP